MRALAENLLRSAETAIDGGRVRAAIAKLKKALLLQPDSVSAHFYLALAYLRLGELSAAERHARRVIALDRRHMNAHLNLGVIKFKQGNVPMAIRNYNIELKKNSRCYEAHYNLGLIDLERKRWKSAVRHLERCWRNQHVAPELGEDLAWAAYNAGLLGLEETIYRRELRKNSRSVWALNNLAAICNHRGQHREARRLLEKALTLSPRDSIVKDNLKHTPS